MFVKIERQGGITNTFEAEWYQMVPAGDTDGLYDLHIDGKHQLAVSLNELGAVVYVMNPAGKTIDVHRGNYVPQTPE